MIDGVSYIQVHPTFCDESLWCMVPLIILFAYRKHKKYEGELFLMYLFDTDWEDSGSKDYEQTSFFFPGVGIAVSQLLAGAIVVGTGQQCFICEKHKNS